MVDLGDGLPSGLLDRIATLENSMTAANQTIATLLQRVRYAKTALVTNSSGVAAISIPAGTFVSDTPTCHVTPRDQGGLLGFTVTTTGSSAAGWTITVTFSLLKPSLAILGLLTQVITSPITFDFVAVEPTP